MLSQRKSRAALKSSGDLLMVILSFLASAWLAKPHAGVPVRGLLDLGAGEVLLLFGFCLAWSRGARLFWTYDEMRNRSLRSEATVVGENVLAQSLLAVLLLFLAKSKVYSRFFVFAYCLTLLLALLLWRAALVLFIRWQQRQGRLLSHVLVVGNGPLAMSFASTVEENRHLGFRLKGFVAEEPHPRMGEYYLGKVERLAELLENDLVDEVIIAYSRGQIDEIGRVVAICGNYPAQVRIIPEYFRFVTGRFRISRFGPFPLFSVRSIPLEQYSARLGKRVFDLLAALLAFLLVFSWLWPLLALLIKLTSPGPVFFSQERWGERNRRILCFKFRTMVRESRDVDEHGRYQQAKRGDPRITRVGRFLRRSNLDELPQFINVLRGEMSLVGPRPHPTPMNLEARDAIHNYQLRHLIKPGITGWAQVQGLRGETSDPELLRRRVEADIWYIENWSFLLDLKIVGLTVWSMLKGNPAAY
jgi:putative colanic acid biosysnthesis UDP-glucose lipid carrier transferase